MYAWNMHKIEFGSQRKERLLFLYTNMAAVTSRETDLLVYFGWHIFAEKLTKLERYSRDLK